MSLSDSRSMTCVDATSKNSKSLSKSLIEVDSHNNILILIMEYFKCMEKYNKITQHIHVPAIQILPYLLLNLISFK